MEKKTEGIKLPVLFLKVLLFSYILTACLLAVLALLLLTLGLGEKAVNGGIIVIYVAATFLTGLIVGKKMEHRKYLWGMLAGLAYFCILFLISVTVSSNEFAPAGSVFTTLILCVCGGMLGGMIG